MPSYVRTLAGILLLHLLLIAVIFAIGINRGWAQPIICDATAEVIEALKNGFGEQDIGGGQIDPRSAVRIFASPGGATFSIVIIGTNGAACVQSFGHSFELKPPPNPNERDS